MKNNDPYVVSKETCSGCRYFRSLGGEACGPSMFCSYTLDTGKFKPLDMKCADCTYKEKSRSRRRWKKDVF